LASVSKKRNSKIFFQGWLDQTIIYRDPVDDESEFVMTISGVSQVVMLALTSE
jgi:hypothetical protein